MPAIPVTLKEKTKKEKIQYLNFPGDGEGEGEREDVEDSRAFGPQEGGAAQAGQVLLQEVQPRHLQRLLQVCQTLRMLKRQDF